MLNKKLFRSPFENYFIIWLYSETKDFRNEFRASSRNGAVRQAFCEPYGFVPPCSVGALVTLHHVGTVHIRFVNEADEDFLFYEEHRRF